MSDYDKLWIQRNLQSMAYTAAQKAIQATGRALPCTVTAVDGAMVTVQFAVVAPFTLYPLTLPKSESQWLRAPVQIGDPGITEAADTLVTTIAGISSGTPNVETNYGNLGPTLVWKPIANVNFPTTPDPNKAWLNGPNGAIAGSTDETVQVVFDKTLQTITFTCGEQSIVIANDPSITSTVTSAEGNLQTIMDGAAQTITHIVPSTMGDLKMLIDAASTTPAISIIAPGGALVGLGALASSLNAATRGAAAQADIKTLASNIISETIQTFSAALGTAASTTLTGGPAFSAIISATGYVAGLAGIQPTIPGCSATVLLAP